MTFSGTKKFAVLMLLTGAAQAWATSTYPGKIQEEVKSPGVPDCTICHLTNAGGANTVEQPFGRAMRDHGLTGSNNLTSLVTALNAVKDAKVDSNGNGVIDYDELAAGTNPNPQGTEAPTLYYGCSSAGLPALGAVIFATAWLWRRRRLPH
ncbi:MAG: hypothetical protein K1X64_19875 [Myxococcaceae bacterium]|nr:hypothetical protein [Myxococcaceae bacterium]